MSDCGKLPQDLSTFCQCRSVTSREQQCSPSSPGLPQSWSCCGRWTWLKLWGGVGEQRTRTRVEWAEVCGRRRWVPSAGTTAAGTPPGWCEEGSWTRGWARGEGSKVISWKMWRLNPHNNHNLTNCTQMFLFFCQTVTCKMMVEKLVGSLQVGC